MRVNATTFDLVDSFLSNQSVVRQYDSDLCIVDWNYKPKIWLIGTTQQRNSPAIFLRELLHNDFPKDEPPSSGAPYHELDNHDSIVQAVETLENMAFTKEKNGLLILNLAKLTDYHLVNGVSLSLGGLDCIKITENTSLWEQALIVDRCFSTINRNYSGTYIKSKSWRESSLFDFMRETFSETCLHKICIIIDEEFENPPSLFLKEKADKVKKNIWGSYHALAVPKILYELVKGDSFASRDLPFDSYIDTNPKLLSSVKMTFQLKTLMANTRFPSRLWITDND